MKPYVLLANALFASAIWAQQSPDLGSLDADLQSLTAGPIFSEMTPAEQVSAIRGLFQTQETRRAVERLLTKERDVQSFHMRILVRPGTEIDHYPFPAAASIESVDLNGTGDFCFLVRWPLKDGGQFSGVFTSTRLVAAEGNEIDGRYIMALPKNGALSINNSGRVAFEAEYANDEIELTGNIRRNGVFIDQHFALELPKERWGYGITLDSDGFILPYGVGFFESNAFPFVRGSFGGQFLIPVNTANGFLLLLATPK